MELKSILNIATDISSNVVLKEGLEADKHGGWVRESMEALKTSKLTGLVVPAESGGMGQGLYAMVRVCEILGASYSSAGLCYGMHCVGSAVLAAKATSWQKTNYLEAIAAGKHITTLALSETGTGAHFYFPQTQLKVNDADIILNGNKSFVTNGGHADSYVISTVGVEESSAPDQFSCVIVDANAKGIEWGKPWAGIGMRGNSSLTMALNNVSLSKDHVLGETGEQLWYVFNVIAPYFLMAMAGTYLGVAGAAFEEARKSIKARTYSNSGTNLSNISIVQHRLGELYEKLETAKALIYNASQAGDKGAPEAMTLILAAKNAAANAAVDITNEAMTLAGGRGYMEHSLLEMLLRDARASHVMSPTTDILYTWIGRALLEEPLLSD
jgi:alkylation response protein AidB-like acyl-CoA dehydrogenase